MDEQDKGFVVGWRRYAAVEGSVLRTDDLGQRAAEVHGGGAEAVGGAPRDGDGEGVVDFEDSRAAVEVSEPGAKRRT